MMPETEKVKQCNRIEFTHLFAIDIEQKSNGLCKQTQQVTTLLAQKCWELLLALVVWCMQAIQTNETAMAVVVRSDAFWYSNPTL